MRNTPILMMRQLSLRLNNLSKVTQLVGDLARLSLPVYSATVSWGFVYIYLPLEPHAKKLEMKVLGATLGQEFPQISFLPKEKYSF
jgi:hypothetical protein